MAEDETVTVQIPADVMRQIIESVPPLEQLSQRERMRALSCMEEILEALHEHRKSAQGIREYFERGVFGAEAYDAAMRERIDQIIQVLDLEIADSTKAFNDLIASGPH